MMKRSNWYWGAAAILLTLTGCMDLEYTGQSFPALAAGTPVAFYDADNPLPAGKYHAIGRAELTAPDDTDNEAIRNKLIKCALEKGADAVAIKEFKKIQTGFLQGGHDLGGPSPAWRDNGHTLNGGYLYSDSFGEVAKETKPKAVYEIRVKALLLVDNRRFEEVTKEYRKERRNLDQIAAEQAKNPATAATFEEMLKLRSPVTPENAGAAKPEPAAPDKKPVQIELQNNNAAVSL